MKTRPKLSCFWIAVLLWALFLLIVVPLPTVPGQRYGPNPHWELGPFILFMFGVAILFGLKVALRGLWDWLGKDAGEAENQERK